MSETITDPTPDGPDTNPATGDEAETFEPPHFILEVHDSTLGAGSEFGAG